MGEPIKWKKKIATLLWRMFDLQYGGSPGTKFRWIIWPKRRALRGKPPDSRPGPTACQGPGPGASASVRPPPGCRPRHDPRISIVNRPIGRLRHGRRTGPSLSRALMGDSSDGTAYALDRP
jgi:hypothetical protein